MIRVNGVEQVFVNDTVATLVDRLTIESRGIAIAVNGEIIRRSDWASTVVDDGAVVEIVSAAAGG